MWGRALDEKRSGRSLLDEECRRVGCCLFHMTHFLSFPNIVWWRGHGKIHRFAALAIPALYCTHRLNMEVDLQSLFGLHVTWCVQLYSLAETTLLRPFPRIWTRFTRALLVRKDRRHLMPLSDFSLVFCRLSLKTCGAKPPTGSRCAICFLSFVCYVFVYIGAMCRCR
jgi:hypothetical protein